MMALSMMLFLAVVTGMPVVQLSDPFYASPDLAITSQRGMPEVVELYQTDLAALRRWWDAPLSVTAREQERRFFAAWEEGLDALDYEALELDDRIDWLLLNDRIDYELQRLDLEEVRWEESLELLPFASTISGLHEARRAGHSVDAREIAGRLHELSVEVESLRERTQATEQQVGEHADATSDDVTAETPIFVRPLLANRVASDVRSLRRTLASWNRYHSGYDPSFTWWCAKPYAAADESLEAYAKHLRETVAGVEDDDKDAILGDPIGRDALLTELQHEFIPYTPEELIEIAEAEFAWCQAQMLLASQELGFGDNWHEAQEYVKNLHVDPGDQPELIRALAEESVDFLEEHDLLTVPEFAKNVWRMEMMSPERQKYTPYFTGGEVISVAFPTDGMEHDDKLMSLRGNNAHFARATVHHELIPGHHLQGYMTQRHKTHRRVFSTPFWGEGWALYWEMLLWDEDFARGPEDRIGMLFWRKHRCARILFSLGFQLGDLTADECVDLLMERVGHERANATAEVRRSVQGGYGPLYQAAYMLGGLQLRALHQEMVGSGRMTNREFHDAVLRQGSVPVELVRATLKGELPPQDFQTSWRFYDD
jgi:uncharacterized protein (DUF885 family)